MRSVVRATALAALAASLAGCGGGPTGDPLTVTIPAGAGLGEVVDTLTARKIVDRPLLFRLYVRIRGADTEIRAGRYALQRGEAWGNIVDDLTAGRVLTERLTIPEGFTLDRMIPRIAAITEASEDSVRAVVGADSAHVRWDVPGPGLEGYLFPETYRFAPGTSVGNVIEAMADRYRAFWTPERRARLDSLGMTEREAVTLASIVQAEARRVDEMPLIAGVYTNRLDRDHPLQADPTVLYALGGPRERLLYAAIDSVADSPYNTYARVGLPPGPIGAPGERALTAALHPAETEYFYFVARPTGEHVFTRTLAQHNRAKARARREWDEARAEAPTPRPERRARPDTTDGPGGTGQPADPTGGTGPAGAAERPPPGRLRILAVVAADLASRLRLIVITDDRLAAPRPVEAVVHAALGAGARAIQLRAKHVGARELLARARALREITHPAGALLFVNDRLDVALAAGADGVHLGPDDLPVEAVRRAAPDGLLIGYSADDPDAARRARDDGADYIGCGSVYGTSTKDVGGEAIGLAALDRVARAVDIPVVAIGGVTPERAVEVARTAAAGVAVVGAVMRADDPGSVVGALLRPFQER